MEELIEKVPAVGRLGGAFKDCQGEITLKVSPEVLRKLCHVEMKEGSGESRDSDSTFAWFASSIGVIEGHQRK